MKPGPRCFPALAIVVFAGLLTFVLAQHAHAQPRGECKKATSDPKCFQADLLEDRILYCYNTNRYYVFFTEQRALGENCKTSQQVVDLADKNSKEPDRKGFELLTQGLDEAFAKVDQRVCLPGANDLRLLSAGVVRRVLEDSRRLAGRRSLGLIGAIICDNFHLYAIDIPGNLIFDHSVFLNGLSLWYVRVAGYISLNDIGSSKKVIIGRSQITGGLYLDNSVLGTLSLRESTVGLSLDANKVLIADTARIFRSKINGSVSFQNAIIGNLELVEAHAASNFSIRKAAFLRRLRIDSSEFSGTFSGADSAVSSASITYSKFDQNVELEGTQARCSIAFSNNIVTGGVDLSNINVRTRLIATGDSSLALKSAWNSRVLNVINTMLSDVLADIKDDELIFEPAELNQKYLSPGDIKTLAKSIDCKVEAAAPLAAIAFVDNTVKKNICFRSFGFSRQRGASESNPHLSFSGTSVSGTTFWSLSRIPRRHLFFRHPNTSPTEVIDLTGFQTAALAVDFGRDRGKRSRFLTTGFRFDLIFETESDCTFQEPRVVAKSRSAGSKPRLILPDVGRLLGWLRNADTAHPYSAAIQAFGRAGTDTTDLLIQKSGVEWNIDFTQKRNEVAAAWFGREKFSNWLLESGSGRIFDYVRLAASRLLGWVADYGYRPQKAFIFIAVAVFVFTVIVSRRLGVKSGLSEVQDRVFPVGWVFILDYMIPGYNIDEAHFKVKQFRFSDGLPIDEETKRRLYRTLKWAKVTGIVAAVFVAAALKTLVVG